MVDFLLSSSEGDFQVVSEEGTETEEKVLICVSTVCLVILDRMESDVGTCLTGEGNRVNAHMCEFSQDRCCTSCSRVVVMSGWKKKKSKSVKVTPVRCPGKKLTWILQRMPPRGWLGAESDGCQCHTASPRHVADVNVN